MDFQRSTTASLYSCWCVNSLKFYFNQQELISVFLYKLFKMCLYKVHDGKHWYCCTNSEKYKQQQTTTKDPHLDATLGLDKGPQSTCLLMLPEPITMSGTTHTMDWILRWSLSEANHNNSSSIQSSWPRWHVGPLSPFHPLSTWKKQRGWKVSAVCQTWHFVFMWEFKWELKDYIYDCISARGTDVMWQNILSFSKLAFSLVMENVKFEHLTFYRNRAEAVDTGTASSPNKKLWTSTFCQPVKEA